MDKNLEIFPWNENFATGIELIDLQHKGLVSLLNILVGHLAFQLDVPSVEKIFQELKEYAEVHFQDEEKIWHQYLKDDPWEEGHRAAHADFVRQILDLKRDDLDKPLDKVVEDIVTFLTHWLALHIIESDKRMAKVVLAMSSGIPLEHAKELANREMSGATRVLIDTVMGMYDNLAHRTIQLTREINARIRSEEALTLAQAELVRLKEQAELGQRNSEAWFSTIFRTSPVAITIAALADDRLVDVNPAFLKMFGFTFDGVIGRSKLDLGLWDDPGDAQKMAQMLTVKGRVENLATRVRTSSGKVCDVLVAAEIVEIEDARYRLSILSDVTDLQRAERALVQAEMEKMHAIRLSMLGEVASTIAHEVNQPIGAATNYLQAAATLTSGSAHAGLIEKAIQQINRAAETIRRVKDFAANRKIVRPAPTPITRLLEDGCALALLGNAGRDIEISLSVPEHLSPIMGDPIQVEQVITNLVRNAAEAMRGRDRRRIEIMASQSGNLIEIEVRDSGPGVGTEVRSRLFHPFVTSKPDGTGLGLSTSRSIIRAHGGELWYSDAPNGGASFLFTLPVAEAADA